MTELVRDDSSITDDAMGQATAHALEEYPREACGIIVLVDGAEVYVRCSNNAPKPGERFRMGDRDYANAEKLGEVVAIVHSHPDTSPQPSMADRSMCELSEVPWRIIAVHRNVDTVAPAGVAHIEPSGYVAPLLGRPFVHGIHDCYAILKDWYAQERNVTLPEFSREDDWWLNGGDLYRENFRKAGFDIAEGPMQEGDIIVMQIRALVWNHAGIYLGGQTFLHHFHGQLSRRDVYGGYWQKMTTAVLRYTGEQA